MCVCVCALIRHVACDLNLRDGDGGRERERCDTPMMIQHSCNLQVICICVLLTSPVVAIYKTHTTMRQLPNAQNTCAHILAYSHNDWTPSNGEGERLTWGSWLKPVGGQINGFVRKLFFPKPNGWSSCSKGLAASGPDVPRAESGGLISVIKGGHF